MPGSSRSRGALLRDTIRRVLSGLRNEPNAWPIGPSHWGLGTAITTAADLPDVMRVRRETGKTLSNASSASTWRADWGSSAWASSAFGGNGEFMRASSSFISCSVMVATPGNDAGALAQHVESAEGSCPAALGIDREELGA